MYEPFRATSDSQQPLFIESLEEAIEALAHVVGGKKKLAVLLRPDAEDEGTAYRWLLEVLRHDVDRRAVFGAVHLIRACRAAREHDAHFLKHWFDDATGYEHGKPAAPKTPEQELADELASIAVRYKQVADDLARKLAAVVPQLKAVS